MGPLLALVLASLSRFHAQEEARDVQATDCAALTLDDLVARVPLVGEDLSGQQWRRLLIDTGVLSARTRWPADEAFAVSARVPDWLADQRVVLHPNLDAPDLNGLWVERCSADCGNAYYAWTEQAVYQTLGTLPLGRQGIPFRIEMWTARSWRERSQPRPGRPWFADFYATEEGRKAADASRAAQEPRPASTAEFDLEIEIVPTLDDAVPPVSTPELDHAVAQALSIWFVEEDGERSARLVLDETPPLQRLGLSLEVELLEGSASRLRFHLLPRDREPWNRGFRKFSFLPLPPALEQDRDARRNWSLRVRGTSQRILRDWEAERRWSGTLAVGLDELLERGREFRQRWAGVVEAVVRATLPQRGRR